MHNELTITELFPLGVPAIGAVLPPSGGVEHGRAISSRSTRPRVLCFSREGVLGDTRQVVLQRRFETVRVRNLTELVALLPGPPFDVIVLCHTFSPEERQRCVALAARAWPMVKAVLVASERDSVCEGFDQIVEGLRGPEALLCVVQQVLRPAVSFAEFGHLK